MEIKIGKWYLVLELGIDARCYILDLSKEDVSEEEISLCIQEQIYGDLKKVLKEYGK